MSDIPLLGWLSLGLGLMPWTSAMWASNKNLVLNSNGHRFKTQGHLFRMFEEAKMTNDVIKHYDDANKHINGAVANFWRNSFKG